MLQYSAGILLRLCSNDVREAAIVGCMPFLMNRLCHTAHHYLIMLQCRCFDQQQKQLVSSRSSKNAAHFLFVIDQRNTHSFFAHPHHRLLQNPLSTQIAEEDDKLR